MSLTIKQAALDLLSKLGMELTDPATAPALAQQDVIIAMNGAMQTLQTAGQDYFTRSKVTQALTANTASYALALTIQTVIGPVRWNTDKPLRALESRGELDQFDRIFNGGTDYGAGSGEPEAYWVENVRSGTAGDINQIYLWLAPVPTAVGTLEIEVINDAPNYAVANIGDTTVLPVAQSYTESIFLPIARMLITRSSQFSRPDILEQLTTDYQVAMQRLGLAGGFPNAEQPEPQRRVTA